MTFKEIETKYKAGTISLKKFCELIESAGPKSHLHAGSYDYYFMKSENEFLRYRAGSQPQLTVKVKDSTKNNFIRTEVNLPMNEDISEDERLKIATAFCETLGFKPNFTIYKNCHIYYFDDCNIVYYVVYDDELRELERFIEIEMNEQGWPDEKTAWDSLVQREKLLASLGITSKNRLMKSLFEIFRKNLDGPTR